MILVATGINSVNGVVTYNDGSTEPGPGMLSGGGYSGGGGGGGTEGSTGGTGSGNGNGGGGGTGENGAHTHSYSETWSFDATQHWHECTANDGAKADVANHTGDPCTVCGYTSGGEPTPAKTLSSITAVYTQPTEIFPDTTLETLKEGLIVTAHYSDNTTAPVTNYTLSGTLTTGTSTVTVSYAEGGVTKTATFTVTVDAPHEHIWSTWTVHIAATCTTAGEERENCTAAPPHYNERPIAALGHDAGIWHVTVAATCIATGTRELRCTRDQFVLQTDTTTLTALGHDTGVWRITQAATCEENGIRVLECTRDQFVLQTDTTTLTAIGHVWEAVLDTATETADGVEGQKCNNDHAHDQLTKTYATGTAGLVFGGIPDDINPTAWRVRKGTAVTTDAIHIPAMRRLNASSAYLPVTEIGRIGDNSISGAFQNTAITAVTIGASVTTIGNYAFSGCTGLTSVTIPASVTYIGTEAFSNCTGLTSVTIPASVASIAEYTFWGCTGLTDITIPAGTINERAFQNCTGLASVTIGAGVTTIGSFAFLNCTGLSSVTFEGTIPTGGFTSANSFPGDLRAKYQAADGGPGPYIVTGGTATSPVWTKQ